MLNEVEWNKKETVIDYFNKCVLSQHLPAESEENKFKQGTCRRRRNHNANFLSPTCKSNSSCSTAELSLLSAALTTHCDANIMTFYKIKKYVHSNGYLQYPTNIYIKWHSANPLTSEPKYRDSNPNSFMFSYDEG